MKSIYALNKKVKYLQGLISEYSYLLTLVRSMQKAEKNKLDIPVEYLANVKKRMLKIQIQLNDELK